MNKTQLLSIFFLALTLGSTYAHADNKLNAEQIKAAFSGKTYDGLNELNKTAFIVYFAPDGYAGISYKNKGGKTASAAWSINENDQLCSSITGCGDVIDMGGGVYQRHKDQTLTHTYSNPRNGDMR